MAADTITNNPIKKQTDYPSVDILLLMSYTNSIRDGLSSLNNILKHIEGYKAEELEVQRKDYFDDIEQMFGIFFDTLKETTNYISKGSKVLQGEYVALLIEEKEFILVKQKGNF